MPLGDLQRRLVPSRCGEPHEAQAAIDFLRDGIGRIAGVSVQAIGTRDQNHQRERRTAECPRMHGNE